MLFFTVSWQAPWRHATYVVLQPVDSGEMMVYVPGTGAARPQGENPSARPESTLAVTPPPAARTAVPAATAAAATAAHAPAAPAAAATAPSSPTVTPAAAATTLAAAAAAAAARSSGDTGAAMPAYDPNASRVAPAPTMGDGKLWVSPRPALPATVAAALYGDTTGRKEAAIERLRAMVDSLNQILDQIQREKQRPKWTTGGTPDNPTWGIDSAYIHVAGIKIPTPVLALLGNLLPQGNFDEEMRGRELNYMREDILRAADRAQSLQEFKRYVHELRDRREADHEAEQRRRAQDTVKAVP